MQETASCFCVTGAARYDLGRCVDEGQTVSDNRNQLIALGLGVGLVIGLFIGLGLRNIAIGIPIGVAMGAGLGIALAQSMDRFG
jgi:hypothetical protein